MLNSLKINLTTIKNFIISKETWDKVYLIFACFVLLCVVIYIVKRIKSSPKKKLDFINTALSEGCVAIGKLTCLTSHGYESPEYYEAEYMYVIDNVNYFVTYRMSAIIPIDSQKDNMNADMLLLSIKPFMMLYYDKNDPKKVFAKFEVFTSAIGISKTKTPKNNAYRDIDKLWAEPLDLV